MGAVGTIVMSVLLLLLAAVLFYVLVVVWPPEASTFGATAPRSYGVLLFTWPATITREEGLFIVVGTVGALGGLVHSLRSFYRYVGSRKLLWSWLLMYGLTPIVAAMLAVVFYVVLRGGLISGEASSTVVSPYGFAAVAGLVGLFSDQAVLKLQEVFGVVFTSAPQGDDPL